MNIRVPFIRRLVLTGCVLSLASLLYSQTEVPADEVTQESLKFTQVYSALEENYMEPLDPDRAIFDGGVGYPLFVKVHHLHLSVRLV